MNISYENKEFFRKVFYIALPIIFQELINSLISIADTVMIGSLGETSITAVSLGNQIFFIFILMVYGINGGAAIFMGQYWGAREVKNIHKTMGIAIISSICVALAFLLSAQIIPDILLLIYTRDLNVISQGSDYLKIVSLTYPLFAFSVSINIANRSTGNTKTPMFTTIITLLTNILFNYIFIMKFGMGVKGAAYGTLIARIFEVCLQIFLMNKLHLPILGKIKDYLSADKEFLQMYLKKALPIIFNDMIWSIGVSMYMVAYGFVKVSDSPQASIQIVSTIRQLFMVVGIGIGNSSGIIIGNLLGANEIGKAKLYSKKFKKTVIVVSILMSICFLISAPYILKLFTVSDSVANDTIIMLRMMSIIIILQMTNFLNFNGILKPGGDSLFCLASSLIGVWCFGVPLAFLGAIVFNLPIYFVYLCATSEEFVKLILSTFRVQSYKWANRIIE